MCHANILVTGGDACAREQIVMRLDGSSFEAFSLCRVALPRDEHLLRSALRSWLGLDRGPAPVTCDHGTLYVDGIEHAPLDLQWLLLQLADRLAFIAGVRPPHSRGPARLAAGTGDVPESEGAQGRLLPALLDRVDKLRVDLGEVFHPSG